MQHGNRVSHRSRIIFHRSHLPAAVLKQKGLSVSRNSFSMPERKAFRIQLPRTTHAVSNEEAFETRQRVKMAVNQERRRANVFSPTNILVPLKRRAQNIYVHVL